MRSMSALARLPTAKARSSSGEGQRGGLIVSFMTNLAGEGHLSQHTQTPGRYTSPSGFARIRKRTTTYLRASGGGRRSRFIGRSRFVWQLRQPGFKFPAELVEGWGVVPALLVIHALCQFYRV